MIFIYFPHKCSYSNCNILIIGNSEIILYVQYIPRYEMRTCLSIARCLGVACASGGAPVLCPAPLPQAKLGNSASSRLVATALGVLSSGK